MEQLVLELAPAPAPTFDNFYAGSNQAVLGALRTALDGAQGVLYLWGSPGCGKSHLLRATADAVQQRGNQAGYWHADAPSSLANVDLVAVDDVEQLDLTGQSRLFDAFNHIRATGGLIVTAGPLPPTDLSLREDLRTRIASGVVMQLRPLADDEKSAVLANHAKQLGLELAPDIIDYLIARFARDLGSLVAAINTLDTYSLRTKRAITLPLLRESLRIQSRD